MIRILLGDSDDGQNEERTQVRDTYRSGNWQDVAILFLLHDTVCWNMCMTLPKG